MKRLYDIIMYLTITAAFYCMYCKIITVIVDIYSCSDSNLIIIIAVGVSISVLLTLLTHRLFRHLEDQMNLE